MANFPLGAPYDVQYHASQFQPYQNAFFPGAMGTTDGTESASVVYKVLGKIPANSNIKVSGATFRATTGGTAPGTGATPPKIAIFTSTTGTAGDIDGTLCTYQIGTIADGDWLALTGTGDAAAGKILCFGIQTGTDAVEGASLIIEDLAVEFRNDWD